MSPGHKAGTTNEPGRATEKACNQKRPVTRISPAKVMTRGRCQLELDCEGRRLLAPSRGRISSVWLRFRPDAFYGVAPRSRAIRGRYLATRYRCFILRPHHFGRYSSANTNARPASPTGRFFYAYLVNLLRRPPHRSTLQASAR